jgi:MGT family glycosyltransferase
MGKAVALIYPTHGHLTPGLAVIEALVRRGEQVVCYATPRARAQVERSGARFHAYEATDLDFNPDPPTDGLLSDMARLLSLTERLLPGLLAHVEAVSPDYLLIDTKSIWGRLVGQILGIPTITLSVVFAIKPDVIRVSDLVRMLYGGAPQETLLTGLEQFGRYTDTARRLAARYHHRTIAPGIVDFLGNPQPLTIVFTSRAFQLQGDVFGDEFQFVGTPISVPTGAPTAAEDELFADPAPLVYLSLGTTFNNAPEFYRTCFEAFDRVAHDGVSCRALISTGGRDLSELALPAPPANVTVRAFVPQLRVLQRARVFVTHGGMNSANEGLYFGVPMAVVPQRGDQHLVAARIQELGAGLALPPRGLTPEQLREAVSRLLAEPGFTAQARTMGETLRAAGGAEGAADVILAHVSTRVPANTVDELTTN